MCIRDRYTPISKYCITDLGVAAFRKSGLITIKIGRFVERLGYRSLDYCSNLRSIKFDAESNLEVEYGAFAMFSKVEEVTFPKSLKSIGTY